MELEKLYFVLGIDDQATNKIKELKSTLDKVFDNQEGSTKAIKGLDGIENKLNEIVASEKALAAVIGMLGQYMAETFDKKVNVSMQNTAKTISKVKDEVARVQTIPLKGGGVPTALVENIDKIRSKIQVLRDEISLMSKNGTANVSNPFYNLDSKRIDTLTGKLKTLEYVYKQLSRTGSIQIVNEDGSYVAARKKAELEAMKVAYRQWNSEVKKLEQEQANAAKKAAQEKVKAEKQAARERVQTERQAAREKTQAEREAAAAAKQAQRETVNSQKQAREAALAATANVQGTTRATVRMRDNLRSMIGISAQLQTQIGMIFSIYMLERFIRDLVTIRGEFDMQLISLKAILQSESQAVRLFNDIKSLAVVSPFRFKELTEYAKQLSAYQIPTNELYDTTKRLADLSAGLGVDMNRIILAYGQVRSAAFLRGQELRQFTEAGLPMVDALADKLTRLQGKQVSAGDVFGLISKRQIPFEYVKQVIGDLTSEGGKFYQMQEKQAQSLRGMISNLGDQYDIMMNRIGEKNDGFLKSTVQGITSIMQQSQKILIVLKDIAIVYGSYVAIHALNRVAIGKNNADIVKSMEHEQKKQSMLLREKALYRELTESEMERVSIGGKMTAESYRQLILADKIKKDDILRLIYIGKINDALAKELVTMGIISEEQLNYISASRKGLNGTGFFGIMKKEFDGTKNYLNNSLHGFLTKEMRNVAWANMLAKMKLSFISFLGGIKLAFKTLFGPEMLIFEALFAVVGLIQNRIQRKKEMTSNLNENINTIKESYNELQAYINTHPIEMTIKTKDNTQIQALIDKYKEEILTESKRANVVLTESTRVDTGKKDNNGNTIYRDATEIEQLRSLREALMQLSDAERVASEIAGVMTVNNQSLADSTKKLLEKWEGAKTKAGGVTIFMSDLRNYINELHLNSKITEEQLAKFNNVLTSAISPMDALKKLMGEGLPNPSDVTLLMGYSRFRKTYSPLSDAMGLQESKQDIERKVSEKAKEYASIIKKVISSMGGNILNGKYQEISNQLLSSFAQQQGLDSDMQKIFNYYVNGYLYNFKGGGKYNESLMEAIADNMSVINNDAVTKLKETGNWDKNTEDLFDKAVESVRKQQPQFDLQLIGLLGKDITVHKTVNLILRAQTELTGFKKVIHDSTDGAFDSLIKDASTAAEAVDILRKHYSETKENIKNNTVTRKMSGMKNAFVDDFIKNNANDKKEIETLDKFFNSMGLSPETDKQRNKDDKAENKAETELLKKVSDRMKSIKDVKDMFNSLLSSYYFVDEAIKTIRESGLSFAKDLPENVTTEDALNKWYQNELNKLESLLSKGKKSDERLKKIDELIREKRSMEDDIKKKAFENEKKNLDEMIATTGTKWDNFIKLRQAGFNSFEASQMSLGSSGINGAISSVDAQAAAFIKEIGKHDIKLNFKMTDSEAKSYLGGEEAPLYKMYYEQWKRLKDAIEEQQINVSVSGLDMLRQYGTLAEKLEIVKNKAENQQVSVDGKVRNLSDYTHWEDGLLKVNDTVDSAGKGWGILNAYVSQFNSELTDLQSEAFKLSSVYEKIFGDMTYNSYGDIKKAVEMSREIVRNATAVRRGDKVVSYKSFMGKKGEEGYSEFMGITPSDMNNLREIPDKLFPDMKKKNPFKALVDSWNDFKKAFNDSDTSLSDKQKRFGIFAASVSESAKTLSPLLGDLSNAFEALGDDGLSRALSNTKDAVDSIANIAEGFATGGWIGAVVAAAGEAIKWITKMANMHDTNLDDAIKKSNLLMKIYSQSYQEIENGLKHFLGNAAEQGSGVITAEIKKYKNAMKIITELGNASATQLTLVQKITLDAAKAMLDTTSEATKEYLNTGNAYNYQRNLYKEQLAQLQEMRSLEGQKKKKDDEKMLDYDSQISEMQTKIAEFSEELASSLYSIDIKGWASELGDALFEAWKKGEDGAEAFRNKANDILGQVVNSWVKTNILEPAMKNLQTYLFGSNGTNGAFSTNNDLTENQITTIAGMLSDAGDSVESVYAWYDKLNQMLKEKGYGSLTSADNSTLGKSIQNVTETTADLLASYLNATRADVNKQLIYIKRFVDEDFPQYNAIWNAQLLEMKAISANTLRMADMTESIRSMIYDFSIGNKKLHVA